MSTAIPVNNALVPDQIDTFDGVMWFMIRNGGTLKEFKALPKVVGMDGKFFVKMSWNSDTHTVSYRETPAKHIATF
jgi:hypothetical protein